MSHYGACIELGSPCAPLLQCHRARGCAQTTWVLCRVGYYQEVIESESKEKETFTFLGTNQSQLATADACLRP